MVFTTILLKKTTKNKKSDTKLLFTDTEILAYEINLKKVYEEFFKQKHLFDFSNYSKDWKEFN